MTGHDPNSPKPQDKDAETASPVASQQPDEDLVAASVNKWLIVAAATGVLFVGVGYTNTFGVFQDYYQRELFPHDSSSKLILIGSVASSLYLILGVFAGRFADLIGYRISLAIGSGLMIGAMFAASACKEFWQFFLSQGLMFGLGLAFAYLPAVTVSRQYFGAERYGLANGIVVSGGALGGCVLPYLTRELLLKVGLGQTFRILGYIAVAVLVPSNLVLRPRESKKRGPRGPLIDLTLLRNHRFIALLVGATIAMTGFLPRYFLITPSAITQGISQVYAAWLLGLMNGLSIVGRVGIGCFADRYGKVTALEASFILCGLGHIVFWLPAMAVHSDKTATALLTLFSVYVGIFGSGFISLFPVVISHLFGSANLASKNGLLNTVVGLGTLAGPSVVLVIISEGWGHWISGVLSSGLLMLGGGLAMVAGLSMVNRLERKRGDNKEIH